MTNTNRHILALPEWLGWLSFMTIAIGAYASIVAFAYPGANTSASAPNGRALKAPPVRPALDRYINSLEQTPDILATANVIKRKTRSGDKKIGRYHAIIVAAAHRYDVDVDLIKAVIMAESSFNPRAVSRNGAKGLMQLMPATAREMGVEDCFDPHHNINGGVRYLKRLLSRFDNDIDLTLAAYNAGIGNVREYGGVPPFSETRYYVEKVWRYYRYYKTRSSLPPSMSVDNV